MVRDTNNIVIYKILCKCCNQYYLGKTQRSLKIRCQEHCKKVGVLWSKRKRLMDQLNPPLPSSTTSGQFSNEEASRVSTRSMTRRRRTQPPTPTTPATTTGLDALLSLFSPTPPHRRENQIPTTIIEGAPAQEAESNLEYVASPTQPSNLTNNPAFTATGWRARERKRF